MANGVSAKIRWDDGEQLAWRRDSLADRPIEILGGDERQPESLAARQTTGEQTLLKETLNE